MVFSTYTINKKEILTEAKKWTQQENYGNKKVKNNTHQKDCISENNKNHIQDNV